MNPIWKSEPPAPKPILLAELQDSPALRNIFAPVAEAAAQMQAALDAMKASQDSHVAALAERIEIRDTNLIATLREIVAAMEKVKPVANLEVPMVNVQPAVVNVPAPVVNVTTPEVTVSPVVNVNTQPKAWTFTHTYDGFGNLTGTKAVPVTA
jgi:hypothetical protein